MQYLERKIGKIPIRLPNGEEKHNGTAVNGILATEEERKMRNWTRNQVSTLSSSTLWRLRKWLEIDLETLNYEFWEFNPSLQPYFRNI